MNIQNIIDNLISGIILILLGFLIKNSKSTFRLVKFNLLMNRHFIDDKVFPIAGFIQKVLFYLLILPILLLISFQAILDAIHEYNIYAITGIIALKIILYSIMFFSFHKVLIKTDKRVRLVIF